MENTYLRRPDKHERIALIIPCYNESEALQLTVPKLINLLNNLVTSHKCAKDSYIVLVDDGSRDVTWEVIVAATESYPNHVSGIRLATNIGHQGALLCGLDHATNSCSAAVSLDADLQDDLSVIPNMVNEFREGAEIVLGVRVCRDSDTWFKRSTALVFYKLMSWMGIDLVANHADFRLMSNQALRNLQQFTETNLFLRGLQPLLHQRISTVTYNRSPRLAGTSKYPLKKMIGLAWDGMTSFSVMPLRLIAVIGGIVLIISLLMTLYALISVFLGSSIHGWASIVIPMYLLGGLIMLSLGIVGEYVGKVFMETKRRPLFLVDEIIGNPDD